MYILTILFVSQVTVVSSFQSSGACEQAAQRALSFSTGPQAVVSARCAPQAPEQPR